MNLSKKAIGLVITLAAIALVGLSVLQIRSLQHAMKTNEQIFVQKVDLASGLISKAFDNKENYHTLLKEAAERVRAKGEMNDFQADTLLTALIDDVFESCGLSIPYEYAVYEHSDDSKGAGLFTFVLGDEGSSLDFELVTCENPQRQGHGWVTLTCSKGYGPDNNYHLGIFFPKKDAYVFAESSGALIVSIIFIAMLLCCFAYTVMVIQRQKKLSTIKNDFINNLTHEFKTPIASISLATNMLQRDESKIDQRKKDNYLQLIEHETKRLEGQVDKVLQIAMIDSGNFSLDKKQLDVHEIVQRVVGSMELVVGKRNGKILLHLNASKAHLLADETHLVNIIYNLVDNALKYSVGAPEIVITTRDHEQGMEICIKDNGIGIGEEIQKYIFDKFYRAETGNIHNVKGFGLGLSYVKKIIEAHKGHIDLTSKIDQGSEFRLYFPQGS